MIDVEKAIVAMASNDVDFVIIDGVALSVHATAYITFDIDFAYSRSKDNLAKIAKALAPFSPRLVRSKRTRCICRSSGEFRKV